MPLFFRISVTAWLEGVREIPESWTAEDTVKLAFMLTPRGVDALDGSTGGSHSLEHPHTKPAYQDPSAIQVNNSIGGKLLVTSVASFSDANLAHDLLEKGDLDMVSIGRPFQKNPGLVFAWVGE